jgi:hypothetical protein
MTAIANGLNKDGYPAPRGRAKGWRCDTVREILANPAYAGDYAQLKTGCGKYNRLSKDGHRAVPRKDSPRTHNPKDKWVIVPDTHEAVIDRETFNRAQELLDARPHRETAENQYALSCLLRCGKCGAVMVGVTQRGRRYYECGLRHYDGEAKGTCPGTTVREDVVLASLGAYLTDFLGDEAHELGGRAYMGQLTKDDLPEAFAELKKLVSPPDRPRGEHTRLKKALDRMTADLTKARKNLVLLDPENIPEAQETIRRLETEKANLEQAVRESVPPSEADINAHVEGVLMCMYRLAEACELMGKEPYHDDDGNRIGVHNGDGTVTIGTAEMEAPKLVKRLLGKVAGVTINTAVEGKGNRTRHAFGGGEIAFRGVRANSGKAGLLPS